MPALGKTTTAALFAAALVVACGPVDVDRVDADPAPAAAVDEAAARDCATAYPDVSACRDDISARLRLGETDAVVADLAALRRAHPDDWTAAYLAGFARFHSTPLRETGVARPHFTQALDLARAADDPAGAAHSLLMLGAIAEVADEDLGRAGRDYEDAAVAADEAGDDTLFFQAAWTVATIRRQEGRFAEQIAWLHRALERLPAGDEGGYRRAGQYALGNAHRKLGDVRTARALLEEVLAMAGRADDPYDRSTTLMLIGVLEQDYGSADRSIALLEQARDVASDAEYHEIANHADMLIGVSELLAGRAEAARDHLRGTLDAALGYSEADPEWTTEGVVNLLFLAEAERRLGRLDEAERWYERTRERVADWHKPDFAWQTSGGLAALHLERGRFADAVREARRGVEEIEALRSLLPDESQRVYFLRQRSNVYAVLAEALAAGGAGEDEVFAVLDQVHSRTLRESLGSRAPAGGRSRELSLGAVQAALAPGELLVEYLLGEEGSLLLAVTRDGAELHRLPPRRDVEAAVEAYVTAVRRPLTSVDARVDPQSDFLRFADRGHRAREMLLGPVAERVAAATRLLVVPDKQLYRLPFGALPAAGSSAPGAAPRFLAESLAIAYLPSGSFVGARAAPTAAPVALVAAATAWPDLGLPALDHAATEVTAVRRAWPGQDVRVLEGAAATPAALRELLRRPTGALHVVGHALLHPTLGPRIVLTGATPGSHELLAAADIAAMEPTPPLVVLSACETAEGELVGGEGILGLVRAFTLAGSGQVVATLWNADDEAAAGLMGAFHARLRDGASASDALAGARRDLLASRFVHPFRWSGFVVYGAD